MRLSRSSRFRILVLGVALWAGLTVSLEAAPDFSASLARLTVETDGNSRTGTGFVVALSDRAAFIVTAKHVVEGESRVQVQFLVDLGEVYDGRVLQNDPKEDLSLVRVSMPPPKIRPLAISADRPEPTDRVILPGFPQRSFNLQYLSATISGYQGTRLVLDGQVAPGNSGGPVMQGENVVGLVVSIRQGLFPQAIAGSSLSAAVQAWLGESVPVPKPVQSEMAQPRPSEPAVEEIPDREPTQWEMRRAFTRVRPNSGKKLTEFKKLGCERSGDEYFCRYRFIVEETSAQSFLDALARPTGGFETRQFSYRRGKGWVMVD